MLEPILCRIFHQKEVTLFDIIIWGLIACLCTPLILTVLFSIYINTNNLFLWTGLIGVGVVFWSEIDFIFRPIDRFFDKLMDVKVAQCKRNDDKYITKNK